MIRPCFWSSSWCQRAASMLARVGLLCVATRAEGFTLVTMMAKGSKGSKGGKGEQAMAEEGGSSGNFLTKVRVRHRRQELHGPAPQQ